MLGLKLPGQFLCCDLMLVYYLRCLEVQCSMLAAGCQNIITSPRVLTAATELCCGPVHVE
jgi:hypothetical protein